MAGEIKDAFLIKLIEDLSSLRSTVANMESHLEKLDDKVVGPFQEWVFEIKTLKTNLERFIEETETKIETIEDHQTNQITEFSQFKTKFELAKAYGAGILFVLGIIFAIAYKLLEMYFG